MALRENRSQSSAISILVGEALDARRKSAAENDSLLHKGMQQRIVNLIKGVADDYPAASLTAFRSWR